MLQQRVAELLRRVTTLPGIDPSDVPSTPAGVHALLTAKLGRDCGEWADQYEPGLGPLDRVRSLTDIVDQLERHFREDPLLGWRALGALDPTDPIRAKVVSPTGQVTAKTG